MKADIEARGLLQNLVVTAVAKTRGSFAVEAGGRRLGALQQLLAEGKLDKTHEVSCLVIEDQGSAQEASLAENFQRLSMNPADECLAFRQLIDQGEDLQGVARRFGLSVQFVEGRLRLAALAPAIFEALGSGEISLDLAKAYAVTPDHERQLYVFDQMSRGYSAPHPDSIRRMMTQATVSADDRRALFVGEDAYVAAGGRVERDLFSAEGEARWLDVALLERLAGERLDALAAERQTQAGLGFVRPTLSRWIGSTELEGLRRIPVPRTPLSDEEEATVEALQSQLDDLAGFLDDNETEEQASKDVETKIRELQARIEAIGSKPPHLDDALKAQVGAFLLLDELGQPTLDCTFYAEASSAAALALDDVPADELPGERQPEPAGLSQRLWTNSPCSAAMSSRSISRPTRLWHSISLPF